MKIVQNLMFIQIVFILILLWNKVLTETFAGPMRKTDLHTENKKLQLNQPTF